MNTTLAFVSGLLVMGFAVAGLFFLRFWRDTGDRLFLLLSAAFVLMGVDRVIATMTPAGEAVYLIRAFAFVLILAAVVDKNRR